MENNSFNFQGESVVSRFLGFFTFGVLFLLGVGFITILNFSSVIAGIALIMLSIYLFSRVIKSVSVAKNEFTVDYFLGKRLIFNTDRIIEIYKNIEGFLLVHVYVVRYKTQTGKIKKITFYCEEQDAHFFFKYLEDSGLNPRSIKG